MPLRCPVLAAQPNVAAASTTSRPRFSDAALAAARGSGALLMLPGNVYNFGAALPPQLREDTPQVAATVKGRLRIESESQVRHATADGAMKAVVIRAGDFFGSGCGSWLDEVMVKAIRRGSFTSARDLTAKIRTFITGWNRRRHPFIWTKTPDQILNSINRKRKHVSTTSH